MKYFIIPIALSVILLSGCQTNNLETMNPFLTGYDTPFGVPPFDIIENDHFLPAFKEGISQQEAEINAIVANSEAPSFENTITPYVLSGEVLRKVGGVFYKLLSAETSEVIDSIAKELVPLTSAHKSNMMLNDILFLKVKAVYEDQEGMNLSAEQTRVLEKIYQKFERGGANLDEEGKAKIRKIDEKLSMLTLQFGNNMLAETNGYQMVIDKESDLAGLPQSVRMAAADAAAAAGMEGKWIITLHKPSWNPFLQYSEKRELREEIYSAMFMRSNNGNEYDNKEIIGEILSLRIERANLLGYETHADYMLVNRMSKEPANVYDLLKTIWEPALEKAGNEAAMMQKMIQKEGDSFKLESWDWWYYAEKIRKEMYDLDEEELRPYFSLEAVMDGLFSVVNNLFGLTLEERADLPRYHDEAMSYEVKESDGSHLGIIYMDFHPRPGKKGGAWSTSIRQAHMEDGKWVAPVHLIVMNFTRPTGSKPALLSFDETLTFFHEFGHALHSMLTKCEYLTTSGTAVAQDFVELPSQVMENWAAHPDVMKSYAKHYESGEMIPDELIAKLEATGKFNQGFTTVEYVAASLLDMDYHTLKNADGLDVEAFEKKSMDRIGLHDDIIPRYRSTYFSHIFAGGYSAGYYSYIWAEVLDKDAFNAFLESSLFDSETALSFRQNILEKGGSVEEMQMYLNFRGQEPTINAMLEGRGLNK
ncbi:MAG: M3 family metallopeptidase [Bacteroidetes bacterium]|nr:M3 family metallopeptidase [Bacteroidota bacterium]